MHSTTNGVSLLEQAREKIFNGSTESYIGKSIGIIANEVLGKTVALKDMADDERSKVANSVFIQSSYSFPSSAPLVFVKDSSILEVCSDYTSLPKVQLTEEQQAKVDAFLEKSKSNPKFQNGEHIVISDMIYDQSSNTIYAVAHATDYATLSALPQLISANYFRLGVISAIVTKDSKTYLLERDDILKLWSSISGFVQPIGGSISDLITKTAEEEFYQEIGNDEKGSRKAEVIESVDSTQISFRALHSSKDTPSAQVPTAEFIAPLRLSIDSSEFEAKFLNDNVAEDRRDHTVVTSQVIDGVEHVKNKYQRVDLLQLNSVIEAYYDGKSGNFLYNPIITSALSSIGVNVVEQFEDSTKIVVEDLATRLLCHQSKKYTLSPETPHLSAIVRRILETQPIDKQREVLTEEIVEAALALRDNNYQAINDIWTGNGLEKEFSQQRTTFVEALKERETAPSEELTL